MNARRPTHLVVLGQDLPDPHCNDICMNEDETAYQAIPLRWYDDASYARYQGDGDSDDSRLLYCPRLGNRAITRMAAEREEYHARIASMDPDDVLF